MTLIHVVEPGETAASIATQYDVEPEALAHLNGLYWPVLPGMTLSIPDGRQ